MRAFVCVLKFSQKTVNHYRFYRYVVFMLQRFIAECQLGYYGKDCQGVCSVNCFHASRCYKFTGQCYVGCKAGWTGNKCDQRKSMVSLLKRSIKISVNFLQNSAMKHARFEPISIISSFSRNVYETLQKKTILDFYYIFSNKF